MEHPDATQQKREGSQQQSILFNGGDCSCQALFQPSDDSCGDPATVERLKSADEHLAGLAEFFGLAPAAPEQFQPVRGSAFRADAFYRNPVAQLKQLFIHFIGTLASLIFHG
jgi:hypothetical protein